MLGLQTWDSIPDPKDTFVCVFESLSSIYIGLHIYILKGFSFTSNSVYVCVFVWKRSARGGQKESILSSGAGVRSSCELPDVGAGN